MQIATGNSGCGVHDIDGGTDDFQGNCSKVHRSRRRRDQDCRRRRVGVLNCVCGVIELQHKVADEHFVIAKQDCLTAGWNTQFQCVSAVISVDCQCSSVSCPCDGDGIRTRSTVDRIVARGRRKRVGTFTAIQFITTIAAIDLVVSGTAFREVTIGVAVDGVVAVLPIQLVKSIAPVEFVGTTSAIQAVVARVPKAF